MKDLLDNKIPIVLFKSWYEQAIQLTSFEPTKMTLATVDPDGMPSARVVLLKKYNDNGFYFFTNYESQKGMELMENPKAALVFHWEKPSHQQIRIRGLVEKISFEESDLYFQSRDRGSQIGAWSSPQSKEIKSRGELEERFKKNEDQFLNKPIPCPKNWGGFCLKPVSFEFWQAQEHRLHDRIKFLQNSKNGEWEVTRLAP